MIPSGGIVLPSGVVVGLYHKLDLPAVSHFVNNQFFFASAIGLL